MMRLESKCGKDFISRVKIKLFTKRCSADRNIRCKHVYHIYEGWDALEKYRANRTLDNARMVINSYANKIIDKFNEYQDKQFEIESKAAYREIEHNKYDFEEISRIINSAKKIGNYKITSKAIGPYKKSALITGAYNSRNHGTRYSNSASLVIMAVMAYVDKVLTEQKLEEYYA
jgi:hypothetical protein